MLWSRVRAMSAIAVVGWMTCGCAMYSETRDKQGQAVQAAWTKVDLKSQIEVPRKNLAALLDEQLSIEDDLWSTRRSEAASRMASTMTVAQFTALVDKGLADALGTGTTSADFQAARNASDNASQDLLRAARGLSIASIDMPGCAVALDKTQLAAFRERLFAGASDNQKDSWNGAQDGIVSACQAQADAAKLSTHSGAAGAAFRALESEREAVQADQIKAQQLADSLKRAQADYKAKADALASKPGTSDADVKAAFAKLEQADKAINSAQNSFAVLAHSQSELDSLKQFLATYDDVSQGQGAPDGSNHAAVSLALFPALADKARSTLADADKPNLLPLVIEKNIRQQNVEIAQREIDRRKKVVALLQSQVDLTIVEGDSFQQMKDSLADPVIQARAAQPLRVLLQPYDKSASPAERQAKERAWRASSRYLDVWGRQRAELGKNRYRISALANEKPIAFAESGINQWKVLIDPSVELMADFGASGIKTSDIKDFLNSLMLLAIAIGVN